MGFSISTETMLTLICSHYTFSLRSQVLLCPFFHVHSPNVYVTLTGFNILMQEELCLDVSNFSFLWEHVKHRAQAQHHSAERLAER